MLSSISDEINTLARKINSLAKKYEKDDPYCLVCGVNPHESEKILCTECFVKAGRFNSMTEEEYDTLMNQHLNSNGDSDQEDSDKENEPEEVKEIVIRGPVITSDKNMRLNDEFSGYIDNEEIARKANISMELVSKYRGEI